MDNKTQARGTARQLVHLARVGDLDAMSRTVCLLTDPVQRERLRPVLGELLSAAAAMIHCQIGRIEASSAIVVDLRKVDGSTVDIDQLQPEVRAVVRALLAEVNEHPDDTDAQISLALAGASEAIADGITLVLMWTVSAMTWCEDHDEPAPGWLAATAA